MALSYYTTRNAASARNKHLLYVYLLTLRVVYKNPLVRVPFPEKDIVHGWYKFNCFINRDYLKIDWSRDKIINAIIERGYPALQGSCSELYLEKCFSSKYSNSKKKYEDNTVRASAHSDWYYTPFENFGEQVDVVLECKKKEQALLK